MSFNVVVRRFFSISTSRFSGEKWRLNNGLGKCGNEYGPLTDLPDWSFADGTQAPLFGSRFKRYKKNKKLARTASRYINDLQLAKENCSKNVSLDLPLARGKIYPITSSQEEKRPL